MNVNDVDIKGDITDENTLSHENSINNKTVLENTKLKTSIQAYLYFMHIFINFML